MLFIAISCILLSMLCHSCSVLLFSLTETCISHGDVYQIKMEILGLKKGITTMLYVLDMVGSIRKC